MSKPTQSSRLIVSPFRQYAGFYQHLLSGITTYEQLSARVLKHIRIAYGFRQLEPVRELSRILLSSPIKEYRLIGKYYLVWCEFREAQCNEKALETVIEQSDTYKSKALIWRANFEAHKGNAETAFYYYSEARKARASVSDYIVASRGIALAKSMEGFHASALKDLERLVPLLRYAEPMTYYDLLNSYAVELIEANRLSEAEGVSRSVVSSSFAPYYPEWRETREEIELRRRARSVVTFSAPASATKTLLRMPMPAQSARTAEPFTTQERARVFDMQEWKKKMTKQDERPPRPVTSEEKQARLKEIEKMTTREKLTQFMTVLGDERVGDDLLVKALAILEGLDD